MKKIFLILMSLIVLSLLLSCAKQDYSGKINPLLEKYIEAWNTGNLSDLNSVVDSTFELRKIPDFVPVRGIKNLEEYIIGTRAVIPDFFLKETEKLFVSDTAVVVTWTLKGTYKGENDLPPTGTKLEITGFSIIYFNGSKLTGEWIAFSDLNWVKQLGFKIIPPSTEL
ncbi:MAG: ester cyclase [Ignavibacteriaceae bacterium]|nr:ester cyclase [Ignavibacteriaceae bacterium]